MHAVATTALQARGMLHDDHAGELSHGHSGSIEQKQCARSAQLATAKQNKWSALGCNPDQQIIVGVQLELFGLEEHGLVTRQAL